MFRLSTARVAMISDRKWAGARSGLSVNFAGGELDASDGANDRCWVAAIRQLRRSSYGSHSEDVIVNRRHNQDRRKQHAGVRRGAWGDAPVLRRRSWLPGQALQYGLTAAAWALGSFVLPALLARLPLSRTTAIRLAAAS